MKEIKTIGEVSRLTFDKKVNTLLADGWSLNSTYINPLPTFNKSLMPPIRYYAVLVHNK